MGMKISISTLKDSVSLSGTSEALDVRNRAVSLEYVSQKMSANVPFVVVVQSLSWVWRFATPRTAAYQVSLSMDFPV